MAPDTINYRPFQGRLTMHFGVLIQPYRRRGLTTGDVAQFLESKYGIMRKYFTVHEAAIGKAMEKSLAGALESMIMGSRAISPYGRATELIQQGFRDFISSQEAERVGIPGTPTQAALRGVNHRLKRPYARSNPRRPSFRDTGLYQNSFRAWVD